MPDKITLGTLAGQFSLSELNSNFTLIETFINDEALSRANATASANQMESDLDLNGYSLQNVGACQVQTLTINGVSVDASSVAPVAGSYMVAGTVGSPGFPVYGDTNTGLYAPAADQVAVSCGGAQVLGTSTSGVSVTGTCTSSGALTVSSGGAAVTGNSSVTGSLTVSNGVTISAGGLTVTGTVTLPAFAIPSASTATTQSAGDSSTKVATTAFVQAAVGTSPKVVSQICINGASLFTVSAVSYPNSTTCRLTIGTHFLQVGDVVYIDYPSGGVRPADGQYTITAVTGTTFDFTVASGSYDTNSAATHLIRAYANLASDIGVTSCTLTATTAQIGFAAFTDTSYTTMGVSPANITAKTSSSITVNSSADLELYGTLA